MSDHQTEEIEETTDGVDTNKMAKSLLHWVSFELILTIFGLVFLFHTVKEISEIYKFNYGMVKFHLLGISILIGRTILLCKVWLSTGGPKWAEKFGAN